MDITTKYDIGHTFWVPRVRKRYETIELEQDGHTWFREIEFYEPYVKLKKIVKITIQINKYGTSLFYGVLDADEDPIQDFLHREYREDQIPEYTEEDAVAAALEFSKRECEYFGEN
jgi:hypothetical protein